MSKTMEHFPELNDLRLCRHGMMLYNRNDVFIGRSLAFYGEYSESEVELFQQLLKPGNLVIEAGGNIGAHTVVFAKTVGRDGLVLVFEPQRIVFQTLCANLALNNLTNVSAKQVALGQKVGTTKLPPLNYEDPENFGGISLGRQYDGEEVDIKTIDSLDLQHCHLIKVDVEGMEKEVLGGALNTIKRLRPFLYVENDRPEHSEALISLIQSLNYRLWWHFCPLYNPNNFDENQENIFENLGSLNMLCIPAEIQTETALSEVSGPKDNPFNKITL
ncbi:MULTISPECIES: FkbM family methyltransferase [Trichocoleus]|nr:FkbM family methyltransferase [Trichocoleus sp. FACHB-46]MBD1862754.1 FkbM family methyltransferase [Trichocoleus sp. FACHB-46]